MSYAVRLISTEEKLTEAFRLRYKIYRTTFPKSVMNMNRQMEFDGYDSRSMHIGLYCDDGSQEELVGYCRLIVPSYFASKLCHAFVCHPLLKSSSTNCEYVAFISYLPTEKQKQNIYLLCTKLEQAHQRYGEVSRLIIDDEHRGIGVSSFFLSSVIAIFHTNHIHHSLFTCHPSNSAFYKRYGFGLIEGQENYFSEVYGERATIYSSYENIPLRLKHEIEELSSEFEQASRITMKKQLQRAA